MLSTLGDFYAHLPKGQIVATAILLVFVFAFRWVLLRGVRRSEHMASDMRRRWIVQIRNLGLLVLLVGLAAIWAAQLRLIVVSIAAIIVSFIVASKELIMCLSGAILKASGHSFSLGDRVEIGKIRGDVIDQTLLTTTILEIGPGEETHQHTGRAVVLPNSTFLTTPITNESFTDEYVLHVFSIPMKTEEDWKSAGQRLLDLAGEVCRPFLAEAKEHMERLAREKGLYTPSVDPRVTIQLPEPDRVNLMLRVPVPARRKGRIEQEILRRYFDGGPAALESEGEREAER